LLVVASFLWRLAEKQEKKTMIVPKKREIIAARIVHMPTAYFAWLPLLSRWLLIWFLMIANRTKSVAITTTVMIHVTAANRDASKDPQTPAPSARRKAINAKPQAMGWRIMTRVRALVVSIDALLKSVLSILSMMTAGL